MSISWKTKLTKELRNHARLGAGFGGRWGSVRSIGLSGGSVLKVGTASSRKNRTCRRRRIVDVVVGHTVDALDRHLPQLRDRAFQESGSGCGRNFGGLLSDLNLADVSVSSEIDFVLSGFLLFFRFLFGRRPEKKNNLVNWKTDD